jgi:hypothetical protein
VDVERFIQDGYVVIRGAFDAETAAACRELTWAELAARGIRHAAVCGKAGEAAVVELEQDSGGDVMRVGGERECLALGVAIQSETRVMQAREEPGQVPG